MRRSRKSAQLNPTNPVDDSPSTIAGISYNPFSGSWNDLTDKPTVAADTSELPESGNLYFTNERVDDRVAAILREGSGIDIVYDDLNGTITITSTGGGGGGGGFRYDTSSPATGGLAVTYGAMPVTVGAGSSVPGVWPGGPATQSSGSTFSTISSTVGGTTNQPGGSGGGGSSRNAGGSGNAGGYSPPEGNNGGAGGNPGCSPGGGGGGGAGGTSSNGSPGFHAPWRKHAQ